MQLHPHFLFNALHSAAMLTMMDPEAAHRVLVQLSALLRSTLDRSAAAEVPLSEEIDFVDRYLAIEQIRFQDRLQVEIDADDDALSGIVPNLILQPLVENAVRHGIARRSDAGCLTIRGARQNGSLVLEVQDDGPGLPDGWTAERPATGGGVGLTNVRSRLERMYGEQGRLELLTPAGEDGHPGRGVLARVTIPYHRGSAAARQASAEPNVDVAPSAAEMIRTLIVDDEPIARAGIRTLLAGESDVTVVGECRDGTEAVRKIQADSPDLVFLDVQMPELTGFEVLASLEPTEVPAIVFVTAYDEYALDAFEASAVDYLLKPFDRDRFARALARARRFLAGDQLGVFRAKIASVLQTMAPNGAAPAATAAAPDGEARRSASSERSRQARWPPHDPHARPDRIRRDLRDRVDRDVAQLCASAGARRVAHRARAAHDVRESPRSAAVRAREPVVHREPRPRARVPSSGERTVSRLAGRWPAAHGESAVRREARARGRARAVAPSARDPHFTPALPLRRQSSRLNPRELSPCMAKRTLSHTGELAD